ncbi:MAG: dTDP-4-dehydrorhamnose reductase [Desulfobacteraceae bacterium]
MKVLLLGSSGMLGSDCKLVLEKEGQVVAPERKALDIVSWDRVIETMQRVNPDVVVNCAAFTDVDACETERVVVRKVNVEGARNLAQGSARFEANLVHISSDHVYNGFKPIPQPYFEDDSVDPLCEYGMSKVYSETAVRENAPRYVILRTGWLYGRRGGSFVHEILSKALAGRKRQRIQVVDDQFGSPTWTLRLAYQIREMIRHDTHGTYHVTAEGYCSRLEFARAILEKLQIKADLEPVKSDSLPLPARRPKNCILENRLLKKQGIHLMQDWRRDLDIFLDRFGDELIKEARKKAK